MYKTEHSADNSNISYFKERYPKFGYTQMKKKITVIIALIVAVTLVSVWVSASDSRLSCALELIASDTVMIRSAVIGENVKFSEKDFEMCLGEIPHQIKISSLPDEAEGTLYLGNTKIFEGQSISRANYPLLVFVPQAETKASSFEFSAPNGYKIKCDMKLTERANTAPTTDTNTIIATVTQADITAFGKLSAHDPENDALTFEVIKYPVKGIVSITDTAAGTYTYTPYEGVTGADSFTYRVRDSFGNYSAESTVSLKISERYSDVVLSDMDGHWAHNAALSAVADGALDVIYEMEKAYFDPEETLTREEYLKAVMVSLGCSELPDVTTVFADDDDITEGYGGYVAAAYKLGIIKGTQADGMLYFEPHKEVTRAEAAVILNRILGAETDGAYPVLSDFDIIPTWAEKDMLALTAIGVISGNGSSLLPLDKVTRAQGAQMVYTAKSLYS